VSEFGEQYSILNYNILIGAIRLTQIRVSNHSCTVPGRYKEEISTCYSSTFSSSVEDRKPFGPGDM
jgi:hypothetical protein